MGDKGLRGLKIFVLSNFLYHCESNFEPEKLNTLSGNMSGESDENFEGVAKFFPYEKFS